jgi:predicted hydrocarbon binding protein
VFIRDSLYEWGLAAGKDDAKIAMTQLKPDDDKDYITLSTVLTEEEGQVFGTVEEIVAFDTASGEIHLKGKWENSFIAEEYLKAFGKGEKPVCRYLEGYASGYFSEVMGKKVVCTETACFAAGEDTCRFEIKNE